MVEFPKRFHRGEKGFTLIELLVVVAILGVLAAVIVPNVGKFIGEGTIESANTEAHNIEIAVIAYMADNGLSRISGGGTIGPSDDLPPAGSANLTAKDYVVNPMEIQATYTINSDGAITGANATPGGEWASLVYTIDEGWHYP